MDEAARVVRPGGRLVVLSLGGRLMEACLEQNSRPALTERLVIEIGGMHPSIYVLARR